MGVSNTGDIVRLDIVLYDRPAGRNIIGHAIDTIERLRTELAVVRAHEADAVRCPHCDHLRLGMGELRAELAAARAAKDGAYLERNQCVALIARMAIALGYWAGTAKTAIEGWSEDWHGCVYIDLPAGQVSWHYHDSQAHLFDWLPPYCGEWDGHDTPEKYERVLNRALMPNAYGVREQRRAEKAEAERDALRAAGELALKYWADRQQRYRNRAPVWVEQMRAALGER